jgi:hypothetical protein
VDRWTALLGLLFLPALCGAQSLPNDGTAAMSFNRSVSVPLNAVQLFDKAVEAWTWSFGREPGAKLLRSDREQGIIEGVSRLNFRSEMLTMREESMGVVSYHITIRIKPGECTTQITELVHTGNRNTTLGGVHLGLLPKGDTPTQRTPGMGKANAQRLLMEVKNTATNRIQALMAALESRLRAASEP